MTSKKFKSVRRTFNPKEKARFERGKREITSRIPQLEYRARARKSELTELRQAVRLRASPTQSA